MQNWLRRARTAQRGTWRQWSSRKTARMAPCRLCCPLESWLSLRLVEFCERSGAAHPGGRRDVWGLASGAAELSGYRKEVSALLDLLADAEQEVET